MIRKTLLALLIPIAMLIAPSGALAADPHPIFVRADSNTGSWTGYTANLQVRPLEYALWPGGFLSDGLFVQNGLIHQSDGYYAFVWAIHDPAADPSTALVPLTLTKINPAALSWVTFQLTKTGSTWTFRYQDATGWHTQGSFTDNASLQTFQIVDEYYAEAPIAIKTQAVQHAYVRTGTTFGVSPMYYSAGEDCGYDAMTSSTAGNVVIKAQTGGACYYRLW